MKRLLLIIPLLLSGCVTDDVDDLKTMAEVEQEEAYRAYYETGVYRGLTTMGMSEEQADVLAAEIVGSDWNE